MTRDGVSVAGLYIHIPFCLTRCGYCDFNTYEGLDELKHPYVHALQGEAMLWQPQWESSPIGSIFIGGGTPTTLPVETLVGLIDSLRGSFDIAADAEVTVEANPDTVDESYFLALLESGVNRISIGAQSLDPSVLASLERIHQPESVRAAVGAARSAGFSNVNVDLIYGAEGETSSSWEATLREAIALDPSHISAYALTVEPNTALGRQVASGLRLPPDPDAQADRYAMACELLASAGFVHYEISNWAQPGRECIHNEGYWSGRPYLGLGAGAHSFRDGRRWWNVRPPQVYLDRLSRGELPVGGEETLTDEERATERLLLGLRRVEGVPLEWLDDARSADYVSSGLARIDRGQFALTERGWFLANEAVVDLSR